jgi:hypothetical protein
MGEIMAPGSAPLKIDVWRYVRHPPPDVVHAYSVKSIDGDPADWHDAGQPAALIGKVISWVWLCDDLRGGATQWHVRVSVEQDGVPVQGYPAEYAGPLPDNEPLAQLKISEVVHERE